MWGANDIELGWTGPGKPANWVDGYADTAHHFIVNFGDAAGCASTRIPDGECGTAAYPSWTRITRTPVLKDGTNSTTR